ncbi:MAG: magnesium transporter [Prevotellaceae bacterium]|jgi:magnesium transporter|nr:magnesium transporter [Prevotellaceae bacterium]
MNEIRNHFGQLIENKSWKNLKIELSELEPLQVAELVSELEKEEQIVVFRLLSRQAAKDTFENLEHDAQQDIIEGLAVNQNKLTDLLNDLSPDDRTAFFEELPGEVVQRLLPLLTLEERAIATRLLGYPEESIGRLMTPEYVAVKPYYTVQQALESIRKYGHDSETLNVIYVVNDRWKLLDDIRIKEIILASPEQKISEIGNDTFVSLSADEDQEAAVKVFKDHDRVALPVVDNDGTLLGIVTVDDVMDVAEEENTEDFQKFGGTDGLDMSYTKTPLLQLVRKRAGWLTVLFLGETLTAAAMAHFDQEIAKAVVLALFVPLIISSGGNTGSQAASLIIRALALGELKLRNWWYVVRKEAQSGFLLGAILGLIGFLQILVYHFVGFYDYGQHWVWVAASVAVSLILVVLWGTLMGSLVPLILKRIGFDPAMASAPFVATLVDVTGLIIYFTIAALFLTGKLL